MHFLDDLLLFAKYLFVAAMLAHNDPRQFLPEARTCAGERIPEVLQGALGLTPEHHTQPAQNRVAAILTHLKFTRHRARTGEKRPWRYWREPSAEKC